MCQRSQRPPEENENVESKERRKQRRRGVREYIRCGHEGSDPVDIEKHPEPEEEREQPKANLVIRMEIDAKLRIVTEPESENPMKNPV